MDITRAFGPLSPETAADVDAIFEYQPWNDDQKEAGKKVREALAAAAKVIVQFVPPGHDRTTALRELRAARMWANSAISFGGRL